MTDYLIVVSAVTSQQYRRAKHDMLRQGLHPRVVRLTFDELVLNDKLRAEDFITTETLAYTDHGKSIPVPANQVCGFVITEDIWYDLGNMFDRFPKNFPRLTVRYVVRADGKVEYV